ncbi:MAG: YdiY family protein [Vicinamibacterales bacterium]
MRSLASVPVLCLTVTVLAASPAFAQAPPEPHKVWKLAASAGLALTSGNADTSNINAAYDLTFDPQTRNTVKSDALYLRGETAGTLSADRLNVNIRDQYRINGRAYVFAQNQYLRDSFKNIDYLLAPTGGLGYKVIDTPETKLDADAGIGGVWEKNPGLAVRSSGAVTFGEKLSQKLTGTTTLTQSFAGLWKTDDFGDSLYTFGVGIAAAISSRTQLKVEVLDVYKNKPPLASIVKNDVATIVAIVFKN